MRRPQLVGEKGGYGWTDVSYLGVRRMCLRTFFERPGPPGDGEMTLRVTYRGGLRVLLNGREIARAHLPAGPIGAGTLAEPYPLEAYAKPAEEVLPWEKAADERQRTRRRPVSKYKFIPELSGTYESGRQLKGRDIGQRNRRIVPGLRRFGTRAKCLLTPRRWQRVVSLRDRQLEVNLPASALTASALKQGANLLALEIVASPLSPVCVEQAGRGWMWMRGLRGNYGWAHVGLRRMALRSRSPAARSSLRRPPGVQVWAEDVNHRAYSTEFLARGFAPGVVRIVAPRNATGSGLVMVGTNNALTGLKASASALTGEDGKRSIPASAVRVSYLLGHPLDDLVTLDATRTFTRSGAITAGEKLAMLGHAPSAAAGLPLPEQLKAMDQVKFFDHIVPGPPAQVPADSCQPVWLAVSVPPDAAAGKYRSTITVHADGVQPRILPLELEVVGWQAPGPRDFQTVAGMEQSPYGVAKQYGVPLWSEEHWGLLEPSIRQLGRAGCDWWFVPILAFTELGNREDSMVKWVRRRDPGARAPGLGFDYAVMDRYLDLIARHCGKPRAVTFLVLHGNPANTPQVGLIDEGTGKTALQNVSWPAAPYRHCRAMWSAFATSLLGHMKARGWADVMYWGYAWDTEGSPDLRLLLKELVPSVYWSAGGHALRVDPRFYRATTAIFGRYSLVPRSQRGWRDTNLNTLNPRGGGNTHATKGSSRPFSFRLLADRSIAGGYVGFGRVGADYWAGTYYDCTKGGAVFLQPGMSLHVMLWPGENGADSSCRYEALLEGILAAEARTLLEQATDRKLVPADLAARNEALLTEHTRATMYIPIQHASQLDSYFPTWQDRTRTLFQAAAEVARRVGLDLDKTALRVDVPARARIRVAAKMRNWTGQPRRWKASADQPWLNLGKTEGALTGQAELVATIDGSALAPGRTAKATLTVTDVSTGQARRVAVTARVSKVLDIPLDVGTKRMPVYPDRGKVPVSVTVGGSVTREVLFNNTSGQALTWKATASEPWVRVETPSGKAPADCPILVKITATPPDKDNALRQAALTVQEAGGPAKQQAVLNVHVMAPYKEPALPAGQAVPMDDAMNGAMLKHSAQMRGLFGSGARKASVGKPRGKGIPAQAAISAHAPHQAVYNLQGKGFDAFKVTPFIGTRAWGDYGQPTPSNVRIAFELYVDGQLRAQTHWMAPPDKPRRLVVRGLSGAKELRLLARAEKIYPDFVIVQWLDPTFYKNPTFYKSK